MKQSAGALLSSIRISAESDRNKNTQLYMAIRDIILSEGLMAGDRLPSSRTLANEIDVSRTTVINAIDRLIAEGLLEARTGSGTYVSKAISQERPKPPPRRPSEKVVPTRLSEAATQAGKNFIARDRLAYQSRSFVTGLPCLDSFPMAQWARIVNRHWRQQRGEVMGYGDPFGHERLREAIAVHVNASRGIHCRPDQIFIVGGAQQAFQLISNTLLNPGDNVWFENPGAIGAKNSIIASGARLVPVDVDDQGIKVEDGINKADDFRLAFVTPSHQQPTGAVMSLSRRFALLNAAEKAQAWIIEDDYDSEFYFTGQPLPTLKSVDTTSRVIYVGTFSKSLFPSLRLGFILSPPGLVEIFEKIFSSYLQGVPTCLQTSVAEFMEEGFFATHVRKMRKIYSDRHETLIHQSKLKLKEFLTVQPTQSGLHTVGYFVGRQNERRVSAKLLDQGIVASPIQRFCITPVNSKGLVLGFGCVPVKQICHGIDVMAQTFGKLQVKKPRKQG